MQWSRRLLIVAVLITAVQPVTAGWIFNRKKDKPSPAQRVPELLSTLRADGDENKRVSAAEELRQVDPQQFPEILPALVDALLHDSKPSVRAEVAQTIGKLRPVHQKAGAALEQALAKDPSMRVRLQARSSLLLYHMAGYRANKEEVAAGPVTKEPPLADPDPPAIRTAPTRIASPTPAPPRMVPIPAPAQAPTLAPPRPVPPPVVSSAPPVSLGAAVARPLPQGPPLPLPKGPAMPAPTPPPPLAPPTPTPVPPPVEGPELTPQPF